MVQKKISKFEIKNTLSYIFKRLCFKYNYPLHSLPILLKKEIMFSNISTELQAEIFLSYNSKYFFRFDLTNAFVYSNLQKRGEIGEVFRYGQQSLFRKRSFIQFDIDEVYSENSIEHLLSLVVEFFKICNLNIVIKYNNITQVKDLILKHDLPLKQTLTILDKLKKLTQLELSSELDKSKISGARYEEFIKDLKLTTYTLNLKALPLEYDYTIIRGLHIYAGFVFEIYLIDSDLAICSGGQYTHNALQYFGISIGLTRLLNLYDFTKLYETLVIYFTTCNKTIILLDSIKNKFNFVYCVNKQDILQSFKYFLKDILSKNSQISNLIFIGLKEIETNVVYVKNLKNNQIEKLQF